jgi:serine/threonine protein kinase
MGPLLNSLACERRSVSGDFFPDSIAVLLIHLAFSTHRHSALKVVKSAGRYAETARDEIKLLSRVSSFSPSHPGRQHIVSFLDSFSHQGPEAQHVCIVFEPLGENLLALIERNKKKGVPRSLVKVIARQILLGLEYLHDECDLVHTDIKPENICEFLCFPLYSSTPWSHLFLNGTAMVNLRTVFCAHG